MTVRKRTSRKTGPGSRRTTTLSSTHGRTTSYSNQPSKNVSRRTVSFNNKTGKTRTTYTTKMGGGWTKTTSKTTGGSTRRKSRGSSVGTGSLTFTGILFLIPILAIFYLWPDTIPYIIGGIIVVLIFIYIVNLLITLLPYIILGSIIYGLYYLLK